MHSHHTHSGDYVSHAVDPLDAIVKQAHTRGFTIFCLTEHMPRLHDTFLYPEELEKEYTASSLAIIFEKYLTHGKEIQQQYANSLMKILVGFEIEGLDQEHITYTKQILKDNQIDMTVGSVHYVHAIPIDFSPELWLQAQKSTNDGTARKLYADYFELQYAVIDQLEPEVIGHFDLIRLFAPADHVDPTTSKKLKDINIQHDWPDVWELIVRNIKRTSLYGGLFEVNSAAIRKGWETPYPRRDIAEAIIEHGGSRFCLSDDSHGLKQLGLNYHKAWDYVKSLGVDSVYHLDLKDGKTVVGEVGFDEMDKWVSKHT